VVGLLDSSRSVSSVVFTIGSFCLCGICGGETLHESGSVKDLAERKETKTQSDGLFFPFLSFPFSSLRRKQRPPHTNKASSAPTRKPKHAHLTLTSPQPQMEATN